MKTNIGSVDRIIRVLIGLAILGAGLAYHSWWGGRMGSAEWGHAPTP